MTRDCAVFFAASYLLRNDAKIVPGTRVATSLRAHAIEWSPRLVSEMLARFNPRPRNA